MKILFLTTSVPYPPHSGYQIRCFNVLRLLSKRHSMYLLSFMRRNEERLNLEALGEYCAEQHGVVGANTDFPIALRSLFSLTPLHVMTHRNREFRTVFRSIVTRIRPDVIIANHIYFSQYLHKLDAGQTVLVLEQHALNRDVWRQAARRHSDLLYRLYSMIEFCKTIRYENKSYPIYDLCFCVSEEEKVESATTWPGPEYTVVPNGVDSSYYAPTNTYPRVPRVDLGARQSLLFTGTKASRNIEALKYFYSEILSLVRKTRPDIVLLVAGDIDREDLPFIDLNDHGVIVTRRVPDIRPYFQAGTIYIVPFQLGGGTKLKVLEAMSMAKPIVSTSVGIRGISLVDGHSVLVADSPQDFADRIAQLLDNPDMRARLGQEARALAVRNYEWTRIVQKMECAIEKQYHTQRESC